MSQTYHPWEATPERSAVMSASVAILASYTGKLLFNDIFYANDCSHQSSMFLSLLPLPHICIAYPLAHVQTTVDIKNDTSDVIG